MNNMIRVSAFAAFVCLAAASAPALADQIPAAPGFVPNGETGDYFIADDGQSFIATTFTLTGASHVSGIGGVFTQFGDSGSVFGAILAAPLDQTTVTGASLPGLALA